MSGSSLGYLYQREVSIDGTTGNLERAVEYLERNYPGSDAAMRARALLTGIDHLNQIHASLADVFKAIEWRLSGDWGEESVEQAVKDFQVTR